MASLAAPQALLLALSLLSQHSPWWEHYEERDSFLCPRMGRVQLERNDSQASLISGGYRSTVFREESPLPGIRYSSERMSLILMGDLLTIRQGPSQIECTRTERV